MGQSPVAPLKDGMILKYSAAEETLIGLSIPGPRRMMYTVDLREMGGVGRGLGTRPSTVAFAQQPACQARLALATISSLFPNLMHQSTQ